MSDENKFFRFLRRFNTVLLTVVGLGLLVMQANMLLEHFDIRVPIVSSRMIVAPMVPKPEYSYLLTPSPTADAVDGVRLDTLERVTSFNGFAAPYAPKTDVNILVTDKKEGTSHWLFHGNDRAIISVSDVMAKLGEGASSNTVGAAIVVAETDSNHDGQIDARDRVSLYISFKDGNAPRKLLTADRIIPSLEGPVEKWLVYYQDGKSTYAIYYKLPEFTVLTKSEIPDMPKLSGPEASVSKIGFTGLDQYIE